MKITLNKSAKRVLSIALALAMLIGTLFTANMIPVDITASAASDTAISITDVYAGTPDTKLADNGESGADWEHAIIIDSAAELVYLVTSAGDSTAGLYYKVADGIEAFDLNGNINPDGTLADNLSAIQGGSYPIAVSSAVCFQGHFDGNGVTVYGALSSGCTYAGLFTYTKGEVSIKNINVKLSSFSAKSAAGGIIGYYESDGSQTLSIDRCSVTDCYMKTEWTGYGSGTGAVIGFAKTYVNKKDSPLTVSNCYVNLDENYFISSAEDGVMAGADTTDDTADDERAAHGGVVAFDNGNDLTVSSCVVIGIKPYATTESTTFNDIQHMGHAHNFKNVYTDQEATDSTYVGGTTAGGTSSKVGYQNFTGYVTQLTTEQLTGADAVGNMNLDWFSAWLPGEEGEYPQLAPVDYVSDLDFWDGTAASEYAGGTGIMEDPFIIKTAEQLYLALSQITGSTSTEGDLAVESAVDVAGGTQTGRILKQTTTDVYVPVYTPYYYKVADGINAFYLNNVYGTETIDGIKAIVEAGSAKNWYPGKSFVGHLDGNGVTIYGLYSSGGTGLVTKLGGAATVKNVNFDSCYSSGSGHVALVSTQTDNYLNDSTIVNIANVSVRNSYLKTTRDMTLTANGDVYNHNPGPAGIVSISTIPEKLTISNCLYDGKTCERVITSSDNTITEAMLGGIISGNNTMNNYVLSGCVSIGAPAVNEVYVSGKEVNYVQYISEKGHPVNFYDTYTTYTTEDIKKYYNSKYDNLDDIIRVDYVDQFKMSTLSLLDWREWQLVTDGDRVLPMPKVNTSDEIIGSYAMLIGKDDVKYIGTGPYAKGANPYTWALKGSGTENDPYIIETAEQLARAIATGGMNLYDKLYYKLGCDIDISDGKWINQQPVENKGANIYYNYTAFGGTLDGDGHTITGLTASDSASAGLIPILAGGTVKNLHVYDAMVVSGNGEDLCTEAYTGDFEGVDPSAYAGIIVGKMLGGSVIGCSVENAKLSAANGYGEDIFIVGYHDYIDDRAFGVIENSYFVGETDDGVQTRYITEHIQDVGLIIFEAEDFVSEVLSKIDSYKDTWYIGGAEGSLPRLVAQAEKMDCVDVDGDGIGNEYTASDLAALRQRLLRNSAYANIYGDVSRNGVTNIADLAVLQRTIVGDYGSDITDSFFGNVQLGQIEIYYGENDNYDAARKIELYLEELTGANIVKVVSSSKEIVTGADSDSSKVYLHAGDETGTPDGKLEIIVGNIDNYSAYKTNTVAKDTNTYAVTYDEDNKVVWLQGNNFTAVEQAAINFTTGCSVQGDVVYTCGSTVLDDYKQPVTVKLDTDYDGTPDTDTVLYYAWGDEFDDDTLDTNKWEHNTQQTEGQNGTNSNYLNLETAPIKDLSKLITIENGKLYMKRGHDSTLEATNVNDSVELTVTPGEFNGYYQDGVNAIDTDGSDKYFTSGKIVTQRGMLFKQGYIEFVGRLPADGHAFPAWWLMSRPAINQSNNGYDNSLYSKVYKLNNTGDTKWDGVTNAWKKNDLTTYKYQIPTAIYEIDMLEVMQSAGRISGKSVTTGGWFDVTVTDNEKTHLTAVGSYEINSTIHKWWNTGVSNDDNLLYIIDWENGKVSYGIDNESFSTTSSAGSWIHNIGQTSKDYGSTTNCLKVSETAREELQKSRKYGFSWNTDGVSGFEATLYIYDDDGVTAETFPIASSGELNAFKDGNGNTEANGAIGVAGYADVYSDAEVFNQYMYILLDNKYYSSNEAYSSGATVFTDLLTSAGLKSLEIEYMRVYQEDGKRDIVTPETENFNNNNHFGYN